jgi:uncharacterized protein (TIGR04255 family)
MADESFDNAPLVEIVAELRWTPADLSLAPQSPGAPGLAIATTQPASLDQLFNTFSGELYQKGFTRIERLIPAGFPAMLHQPIFRFRKDDKDPALFQIGLGLFSANGLQPYRSWKDFSPTVELGVGALLKGRVQADQQRPFSLHSLRYIDAFGDDLLAGHSIAKFLSDTLGVSIVLPAPIQDLIRDPDSVKSQLQLIIPIKGSNKTMELAIGEGSLANAPTTPRLIMQMTITEQTVDADAKKIMAAFDSSRKIIHDTFLSMTKPIHPLMKPHQKS